MPLGSGHVSRSKLMSAHHVLTQKGASELTHNVGNTIHPNPMRIISLDEAGPFYLINNQGEYDKTYILVCIELLTYKCHLIPLPRLDTLHFIRVLEILHSLRRQMTTQKL